MIVVMKPKLAESTDPPMAKIKGVEYVEVAVVDTITTLLAVISGVGDHYALLADGIYHVCERQP